MHADEAVKFYPIVLEDNCQFSNPSELFKPNCEINKSILVFLGNMGFSNEKVFHLSHLTSSTLRKNARACLKKPSFQKVNSFL